MVDRHERLEQAPLVAARIAATDRDALAGRNGAGEEDLTRRLDHDVRPNTGDACHRGTTRRVDRHTGQNGRARGHRHARVGVDLHERPCAGSGDDATLPDREAAAGLQLRIAAGPLRLDPTGDAHGTVGGNLEGVVVVSRLDAGTDVDREVAADHGIEDGRRDQPAADLQEVAHFQDQLHGGKPAIDGARGHVQVLPLHDRRPGDLNLELPGRHHVARHDQRVGQQERGIAEASVAFAGLTGELDHLQVGGIAEDHRVAGVLATDDDLGEAVGQGGQVAAREIKTVGEGVAVQVGAGRVFTGRAETVVPYRLVRLDAEHAGANDLGRAGAEADVVGADGEILAGCLEDDLPRLEIKQRIAAQQADRQRAVGHDDRIRALSIGHLVEPALRRGGQPAGGEGAIAEHEARCERRVVVVDVREDEVVLLGDGDVAGGAVRSVGEC